MCSDLDSLITCAQADVGKACQGGGQCYLVSCGAGQSVVPPTTVIYKCAACPPVVPTTDGGCSSYTQLGMPCGAGGTCGVLPNYCVTATTTSKLACLGPTPAQPTGPPTGEGGGGAGGAAAGGAGGGAAGGAGAGAAGGVGGGAAGGAGQAAGGTSGGGPGGATVVRSGGGGCDVVPRVPSIGVIALALLLVGLVALVIDRRRRGR